MQKSEKYLVEISVFCSDFNSVSNEVAIYYFFFFLRVRNKSAFRFNFSARDDVQMIFGGKF